ncbi:MAG: hypothetical protein MR416_00925 [Lachnospiraceae bacterium]|nr:hypothetical protein [Lachnospiraceae bacterium]
MQVIMGAGENCRRFVGGKPSQQQMWIRGDIRPAAILKYRTVFPPAGQESLWYEQLSDHLKEKIKTME